MLERIRTAVSLRDRSTASASRSSASTPRAPTSTSSTEAYEAAVEAGAQEVVVVDTLGIATPEAAAMLVSRDRRPARPDVPVHWHGHDDFGLGDGRGDRRRPGRARPGCRARSTGWASGPATPTSLEVALALEALYGIPTRLDLTQARALSHLDRRERRDAAAPVEGRHRRRALHARVGRGRGAVPRPAGDRAVLLGARRRRARHRARQEERDRLDPDRRRAARARRAAGASARSCSPR